MADHALGTLALCALPQSGFGTPNPTITALTDTANTANGLLVGIGDTGDANSGIELAEHERIVTDLARLANSRQQASFLREAANGLKITVPAAGGRNTSSNPVADEDFDLSTHWPGMDAILKACGLSGAADGSATDAHIYSVTTGTIVPCSVGVWFGGLLVVYKDVLASLKFECEPGTIGRWECEFEVGGVHSWATQALTTVTQGNQATAAPVCQDMAAAFGATRPFRALTLEFTPNVSEDRDSNATNGVRKINEGVDVSISAEIYAATSDPDYERDKLIITSAQNDNFTFRIGTATGVSSVCNSLAFALNNVQVDKARPAAFGSYLGWEVEYSGRAQSSGGTEGGVTYY